MNEWMNEWQQNVCAYQRMKHTWNRAHCCGHSFVSEHWTLWKASALINKQIQCNHFTQDTINCHMQHLKSFGQLSSSLVFHDRFTGKINQSALLGAHQLLLVILMPIVILVLMLTSMPSNLMQTIREWVYLVRRVTSGHMTETAVTSLNLP